MGPSSRRPPPPELHGELMGAKPDYDDEARKLFARLNIKDAPARTYNDADCVYVHPSGAKFYIGNRAMAESRDSLLRLGITRIVNCQEASSVNFHEGDRRFEYLRFPISFWKQQPQTNTPEGLLHYMNQGLFRWVDERLSEGNNVMVHCLAGAHRAGTSGVAYVMHASGLDVRSALRAVQARRPVVDPIFDFKLLLETLDTALHMRSGDRREGSSQGRTGSTSREPSRLHRNSPPTVGQRSVALPGRGPIPVETVRDVRGRPQERPPLHGPGVGRDGPLLRGGSKQLSEVRDPSRGPSRSSR